MCLNDAGIIIKRTYCLYGGIKIKVIADFCYKVSNDVIYGNGRTDEVKMNSLSPGERKHIVYDLDFMHFSCSEHLMTKCIHFQPPNVSNKLVSSLHGLFCMSAPVYNEV